MNPGKLACSVLLSLLTVQLPACSFNMNVETMLSPPRLTAEQEQIYHKLQDSVGSQPISLKYPKYGDHLSAFTIADLDGNGSDEAIVFYESGRTVAEENPLRIGLFSEQNGEWQSIDDIPADGAEIERIDITKLGKSPRTYLILSFGMVDGADHKAVVMYYKDSRLNRSISVPYTKMALRDLDGDGTTELFAANAAKGSPQAAALTYSWDENGRYTPSEVNPDSFTDITQLTYGEIPTDDGLGKMPVVYMDCLTGATSVQTVVLTYQDQHLRMVYADSDDPNRSERGGSYLTMDIDGDGEAEIPVSDNSDNSPMQLTNWFVCRGGRLMREHASYYAAPDGFVFLLPKRWEGQVTAVPQDGETVFYQRDPIRANPDGTPVLLHPLLRLTVATDPVTADGYQTDGYLLLRQQNGRYYLGRAEQGSRTLSITDSELLFAMQFL